MQNLYVENGFVVLKDVFQKEHLRALLDALCCRLPEMGAATADDRVLAAESKDHKLVYDAAQSAGSAAASYRLLGSGDLLDQLYKITGLRGAEVHIMPLYFIVQLPGDERFDYGWHQDRAYYEWCERMVTLWFPVNRPATATTGTISVIAGSHRVGRRAGDTHFRHGYFRQIESIVDPSEIANHTVLEMNPGDCCVMDGDLVHRSIANHASSPRIAGVVRIASVPAGTQYERERFFCVHKS